MPQCAVDATVVRFQHYLAKRAFKYCNSVVSHFQLLFDMNPELRPGLLNIRPHMLSADPAALASIRINIGSNESAFGPSPSAISIAIEGASCMERYADGAEISLSRHIADNNALDPAGVVCGNGSDDLLARLARAFLQPGDELICSVNGYQKFPNYALANDAVPILAPDDEFRVDVDGILNCVTERTRIVMIANPDNPTGTWLKGREIRQLHAGLPENVLLILDSAYLEYVDDPEFENPAALVEEFENVAMTRTFSKIYGLAGIRLGWLYAPHRIADAIRRIGLTFPLSNIAFECGKLALADKTHLQDVFDRNRNGRTEFKSTLDQVGALVYPSQTNFLLAKFSGDGLSAAELHRQLINHGIFARRQTAKAFSDCIRFTIGTESQMDEVAQTILTLFSRS